MRKQFYHKYLEEPPKGSRPGSQGLGRKIRNMVYANKEERIEEKDVCAFILTRVLNQSNLSKITGITTKSDLEKRANLKRLEK